MTQTLQQNGPITVDGDPLDPFDSSLDDLAVGKVAPVVSGESFDGTPIAFGGPTENATLVVFLAHWCPHCNDEIPELLALDAAGELPDGLDVIGVSTAVDSTAPNYPPSDWVVEKGWEWPMMADDENPDRDPGLRRHVVPVRSRARCRRHGARTPCGLGERGRDGGVPRRRTRWLRPEWSRRVTTCTA